MRAELYSLCKGEKSDVTRLEAKEEIEERTGKKQMDDSLTAVMNSSCYELRTEGNRSNI